MKERREKKKKKLNRLVKRRHRKIGRVVDVAMAVEDVCGGLVLSLLCFSSLGFGCVVSLLALDCCVYFPNQA